MPTYTLERGGKTATVQSPRDLSPDELSGLSTQYFGPSEKTQEKAPALHLGGFTQRFPQELKASITDLARMYLNPQTPTEHLQSLALTTALTGGAGTLAEAAGLPAWAGRVGLQGLLGLGEGAAAGGDKTRIAEQGLGNVALSGLTEAVAGHLAKPGQKAVAAYQTLRSKDADDLAKQATKFARRLGQYTQAQSDVPKAMEAAADVIHSTGLAGQTRLVIPTLSREPMRLTEIVERLGKMEGREYTAAISDVTQALNAKVPGAGDAFRQRVSSFLVSPGAPPTMPTRTPPGARLPAATSGLNRAAVESGLTQPIAGIPAGAYGALAIPYAGSSIRRMLPFIGGLP